MSLNETPVASRLHIGIFGRRNAGKSSIINAIIGQNLSIVSDVKGTTTDPVLKSMELLPLGPVVLIDTPGLDDEGTLGELRVQKAVQMLNKTDLAILVVDGEIGMAQEDREILKRIQQKELPYIVVYNKWDLQGDAPKPTGANILCVSTRTGENIFELKELIARQAPKDQTEKKIVGDLLSPGDFVVLVIPIDSGAPKGRLILPQQQTIRDILEAGAAAVAVRDTELKKALEGLGCKPALVITDSQAFAKVAADVPEDIPLTSFSILFARYKGNLKAMAEGAYALDILKDNDTVLISEGCTHHRQCDDIGSRKLPRWILGHTGKKIRFVFTSGTEFPSDLSPYRLIVHCGGCMLNEREMKSRLGCAAEQGIPMTNYGTAIAHMKGILKRSLEPFSL